MKRATEEKIRAIKRRYNQLQDLIKTHKARKDADLELEARLEKLGFEFQAEGFQEIPEE